jgi:hypothetical protein
LRHPPALLKAGFEAVLFQNSGLFRGYLV